MYILERELERDLDLDLDLDLDRDLDLRRIPGGDHALPLIFLLPLLPCPNANAGESSPHRFPRPLPRIFDIAGDVLTGSPISGSFSQSMASAVPSWKALVIFCLSLLSISSILRELLPTEKQR